AGITADFNGDGCTDIAFVGRDGHLRVIYREAVKTPHMGLTVSLPAGVSGPLNIIGYDGKRCLGVRVVTADSAAFFGRALKGPLTVKWKTTDGKDSSKTIIILKSESFTLVTN
ncbi:MAG: hypothetical protein WCJ56_07735, partial [bacterium]